MLTLIKMVIELVNLKHDIDGNQNYLINYVRVTRAIRPIFLVDNHLMSGVRRYINFMFDYTL